MKTGRRGTKNNEQQTLSFNNMYKVATMNQAHMNPVKYYAVLPKVRDPRCNSAGGGRSGLLVLGRVLARENPDAEA